MRNGNNPVSEMRKELESKVYFVSHPTLSDKSQHSSPSFPKLFEGFNGAARLLPADTLTAESLLKSSRTVSDAPSSANPRVNLSHSCSVLKTYFQRRRKQDTPRLFKRSQDQNGRDVDAGIPHFTSVKLLQASAPLPLRNDLFEHLPFLVGLLRAAVLGASHDRCFVGRGCEESPMSTLVWTKKQLVRTGQYQRMGMIFDNNHNKPVFWA